MAQSQPRRHESQHGEEARVAHVVLHAVQVPHHVRLVELLSDGSALRQLQEPAGPERDLHEKGCRHGHGEGPVRLGHRAVQEQREAGRLRIAVQQHHAEGREDALVRACEEATNTRLRHEAPDEVLLHEEDAQELVGHQDRHQQQVRPDAQAVARRAVGAHDRVEADQREAHGGQPDAPEVPHALRQPRQERVHEQERRRAGDQGPYPVHDDQAKPPAWPCEGDEQEDSRHHQRHDVEDHASGSSAARRVAQLAREAGKPRRPYARDEYLHPRCLSRSDAEHQEAGDVGGAHVHRKEAHDAPRQHPHEEQRALVHIPLAQPEKREAHKEEGSCGLRGDPDARR
mmetsp:Transcript_8983/g.17928  ORF Transcript_8983/g.17928 Transcript_8983/m.17928 type:complete len:343 (-) Transcript_8983:13-1041(-)